MRRLFVVYNTASSHAAAIKGEVLEQLRGLPGWIVGKFQIKAPTVDENVRELVKLLDDGDLVIAAGGDGTAAVAANAVMVSGKDATLAVLGYGNRNDMAGMLGMRSVKEIVKKFEQGEVGEIYPLEVLVNGEHWRYAPCYVTVGLLAEATELMDDEKVRKKLNTGKRGTLYSLMMAVKWYLKNKKRKFLPAEMRVNGKAVEQGATDYLAVNGPTLAGIMKGGEWYREAEGFGSTVERLGKFWKMVGFGLKSVFSRVPLAETRRDVIEFLKPAEVEIQAEGEYQRLAGVEKIEVKKGEKMKVVGRL